MCSSSTYAICCVSRFAAAQCTEQARLEREFQEARDRMCNLMRLGKLTRSEERAWADRVAMAIARLKERIAAHGCER
jgi:hypothetical protein